MNKNNVALFLCIAITCLAFTTDVQKRSIRENGFDVECYIAVKKLRSFDDDKTYYWFKSGGVHQSTANAAGNVLHDAYLKYYRSNQLAEKGTFSYGLKTGVWKSWFENGQLRLQESWTNGYLDGEIINYDSNGNLVLKGKYRNNARVGQWINYRTKDTSYYKKDIQFEEKPQNLIQRVLRKKDSLEKIQIKTDRIAKKRNDSIKRVKHKLERRLKKRNDSIKRVKAKQLKLNKRKQDSLDRVNKKQNPKAPGATKPKKGFFKKLFKKKN